MKSEGEQQKLFRLNKTGKIQFSVSTREGTGIAKKWEAGSTATTQSITLLYYLKSIVT